MNADSGTITGKENCGQTASIMVSVLAFAYNHEEWLERALDSFIAQQTHFNFEILIHDDASSDRSAAIIRKYEQRFPGLIKPVLQTENQFSQGRSPILLLAEMASGKYLALCECDDYWTDPLKLQKQVALLEVHPEYSMCVAMTEWMEVENDGIKKGQLIQLEQIKSKSYLEFNDIVKLQPHTSTYVINAGLFNKNAHWFDNIFLYDKALLYVMSDVGKIGIVHEAVSCYHKTSKGIWSSQKPEQNLQFSINLHKELYLNYKPEYKKIIGRRLLNDSIILFLLLLRKSKYTSAFIVIRMIINISVEQRLYLYLLNTALIEINKYIVSFTRRLLS